MPLIEPVRSPPVSGEWAIPRYASIIRIGCRVRLKGLRIRTFEEARLLFRLDPQQAAHLFFGVVDGMRVRLGA